MLDRIVFQLTPSETCFDDNECAKEPIRTFRFVFQSQKRTYFWACHILKTIAMNIPSTLKYTKDHEWVRVEGEEAYVGVTDFAQGELGDIVYVEIETVGDEVAQGEVFGTIEAVKTVSDLFMPVSGTVLEFNEEIESAPELVNEDPYEKGWMAKIAIKDTAQLDELLDAEAYQEVIGQ